MFDLLRSLLAFLGIALAAFGFGRPVLRALRLDVDEFLGIAVWSLAFGVLVASGGLAALALVGWLSEVVVLAVSLCGILWATVELSLAIATCSQGVKQFWFCVLRRVEVRSEAGPALALATFVLGATFARALAPPLSPEVLSRSLAVPKEMLLSHGISPAGPHAAFPNLSQIGSVWALALDGPVAANLVHWGLGLLLALATVLLGRPLLGARLSWLAGVAALLVPAVQRELGVPLEGVPLAFFAALALAATRRTWFEPENARAAVAAGLMAGAAASIDPAGALFALALAAIGGTIAWAKRPLDVRLRWSCWQMSLVALVVSLPWIGSGALGSTHSSSIAPLATLGPVIAIAFGGLLFARRLRGFAPLLCAVAIYTAIGLGLGLGGHVWAPVVPIGAVLAAWTWREMGRLPVGPRWVALSMVLLAVMADLATLWRSTTPCLAVAVGWQTREEFLLSREGNYRAASVLNAIDAKGQVLLTEDPNAFYFTCATRHARQPIVWGDDPARGHAVVSAGRRAGASYVLLAEPVDALPAAAGRTDASSPVLAEKRGMCENLQTRGEVIPIIEYRFADDNNRCIRYRLWKLQGPPVGADALESGEPPDGAAHVGRLPRPATR